MNYSELPILVSDFIKSDFINLRPIKEFDTGLIVKWRNKESVKKNFLYRSNFTAEIHQQWFREKVQTGVVVQFIIEMKNYGELVPVCTVYLRDIDYENLSAEFGTTTARKILEFGLNELGLHRIFLRLLAENIVAYKAYRKAGFITEGVFRDMKKIDGKYKDIMFMSSLSSDFYVGEYNSIVRMCGYPLYEVAA